VINSLKIFIIKKKKTDGQRNFYYVKGQKEFLMDATSNFTRHARKCHQQAFDIWFDKLKKSKSMSLENHTKKITNLFQKTSYARQCSP
jgi:hypothetical protein